MADLRKIRQQQLAAKERATQKQQQVQVQKAATQRENQATIDATIEKHGSAGHHEHVLHTAMMALNNAATQLRMKEYKDTRSQAAGRPITEIDHSLHQAQLNLDEHRAAKRQGDLATAAKWMKQSANHIVTASKAINRLSGQPRFSEQTAGRGDAIHSHEHVEKVVNGLADHFSTKVAGYASSEVLSNHRLGKMTPKDTYRLQPDATEEAPDRSRVGRAPYLNKDSNVGLTNRTETHTLRGAQLDEYNRRVAEQRGPRDV